MQIKSPRSMASAMDETARRRRRIQKQFNEDHGIVPKSVKREIREFKPGDKLYPTRP